MAEKSVIASISQAEQRPFKTPQPPALRAVVSEPAQQKRRFFLLLYFQSVGSPSILEENVFQQSSPTSVTRCQQGLQNSFGGHGAAPLPFARHSGSRGQTERFSLRPLGDGVLFVNSIAIPVLSGRAFPLSALQPPGRPKWARAFARNCGRCIARRDACLAQTGEDFLMEKPIAVIGKNVIGSIAYNTSFYDLFPDLEQTDGGESVPLWPGQLLRIKDCSSTMK